MRRFLLKSFALIFFVLCSVVSVHAQTNNYEFVPVYAQDSLKGFDEKYFLKLAAEEGLPSERLRGFIEGQKRVFVDTKYNLKSYTEPVFAPSRGDNVPNTNGGKFGTPATINVAPCVNEGFELGNITGWVASRGTNVNSCAYANTPLTVTFPSSSLSVVSTTITDPVFGALGASPFPGSNCVKINDATAQGVTGGDVVRLSQTYPVTNSNFMFEFAYRAVMATAHPCCQQTYMQVNVRNAANQIQNCPTFTFAPPATSGTCSSPGITWSTTTFGGFSVAYNPTWQKYSIDLSFYIGSNVTIDVTVSDCSPTAHWGYVYFDAQCSQMGYNVNGNFFSSPTLTNNPIFANCGTTATVSAPGGFAPYSWNGPPGSGVTNVTTQSMVTTVAGNYTMTMQPPGACNSTFRFLQLTFPPPVTITPAPSATLCGSQPVTLTASGASSYTWVPSGFNSNFIVVTPTTTTTYSLSGQTGTCIGSFTREIVVNPSSTVNILTSNTSLCPGQVATLTALGASSYTWFPSLATTQSITVTQTATTTYSVIGTETTGCTGNASVNIAMSIAPSLVVTPVTTTYICAGGTVLVFAGGATNFTWNPGGLTGFSQNLQAFATTVFTIVGSSGSCTNSAQLTVSVDPGPTVTIVQSPTIICPGNSTTLTANGASALGYTWQPGGTAAASVAATPTAGSTYSVYAINLKGCISENTISPLISPVPSLTITPATPTLCFGSALTLTASGASTYTWNPLASTGSTAAVSPTANTVYALIGSNGTCTSSINSSVVVVPLPTLAINASSTAICLGESATLTANGASTYTWLPSGSTNTSIVVTPTITTSYTLIGKSAGCDNFTIVTITVNNPPNLSVSSTPTAICPGFTSTLSGTGAATYTWNPGGFSGANPTVSPSSTTIYTATGASTFGCISTRTVALVVHPSPTVNATVSSPSICIGSSATLSANGASTYVWNPGAIAGSVTAVSPTATTLYTVTGTSSLGCSVTRTVNLIVVPLPTVVPAASPTAVCIGFNSTLTATGATSYTWNPGVLSGSSAVVSPTSTTVYTVTGASAGCSSSSTVQLIINGNPTITAAASPTAVCPTFSSTLTANGAASYTWNPGALTGSAVAVIPAATTIYTATGASTFGCLSTRTVAIIVNPTPTVNLSTSVPSICVGSSASLTANGAQTYTWIPGSLTGTNVVVSPTSTTVYTVVATSSAGCVGANTINLIVVPNPTVSAAVSPTAVCIGFSATLTANGATSYTWNPSALTGSAAVVSPTSTTVYTVTGNTAGCSATSTVQLIINGSPTITAAASPTAVCPSFSSTLTANGASSYTWNPGALTGSAAIVTPTATTVYTVTGASAFGCISTQTVALLLNPTPTVNLSVSVPSICVGSSASLTATGAQTYTWNPGSLTGTNVVVSPTATTIYTVVATSSAGCVGTNTINLIVVPNPTVSSAVSPTAVCIGFSATLTANGATSYTWNPSALTGSAAVVSPTSTTVYTVTGNTAGCSATSTVQLIINGSPTITAAASPTAVCPSFSSTLTANGASSYTWNPGALTGSAAIVTPTATTVYTVTGASAFGCISTQTVALLLNPTPTVNLSASAPSICVGSSASLTANGAQTYTWNPGSLTGTNVVVSPTSTTVYTVVATSSAGCVGTNTINLIVVPNPTVSASVSPTAVCIGFSATLSANGATSYTWNPSALTGSAAVVSPTSTTVYTVTGNTAGCSSTSTVQLIINGNPTISAAASPTAVCPSFSSTLSANGASSYTWNPGALTGSAAIVTPTATTVYTVTGASAFGCLSTQTVSLLLNPTPTVNLSASAPSICVGSSASLTATGAQTYTWNPGSLTGTNIVVSPTATTIYTVVATSSAGCVGTNTINLIVVPNPTVSSAVSPTAVCIGFSATLTANGASSYTWNPSALTGSAAVVSPTSTTVYTVTGNTAGCSATSTVALTIHPNPPLIAAASPTAVCPGFTSLLTSAGAVSYTWNPGSFVSSNITVTPSATSSYTVSGESAFGCITTQTVSVIVEPTPTINLSSSVPSICVGSSASLSATGAQTYTWNPGSFTGTNVVVSPTSTTIYTVVATSSAGCLGTNTINLIVVPNPTVSSSASPTGVCIGFSATLTANGATSYTWNPSALTGSAAVVSPTSTTVYTVTGNTAGCSSTSTVALTIHPNPPLIAAASPTAVCPGFTSLLTSSGAASYTWNPGSFVSSNITVTPSATSSYTVSGESAFGCITTQTLSVVVEPTPTLNLSVSVPSICVGSSASLTANGAQTYTWIPGSLTGTNVVVSPTSTTVYTVVATSSAGCVGANTINLIVVPNPTVSAAVSPTAVCIGFSATLTANGATSYTWNPSALTGSAAVVSPTSTTVYTVTGNTAGCSATSTVQLIINGSPTITAAASPTAVCPSFSSTLTANGASSYTWNPGALTGSAAIVTPTATTVYTVTGASAFGCISTQTVALLLNPTPTVNLSASAPSICVGSSASLTANGAQTYTWNPGSLTGTNVVVSPTATTIYTVVATSSAGCVGTNTINLIVVPNPTVTSAVSPTAVCIGSSATLSANGATSYTWNPSALTGSAAVVSPTSTTVYTVTGNTAGCSSSSTVQLIIQPLPSLTITASSASICSGNSTSLSATGAQTYTWLPGSLTATSIVVSPTATANYTLIGASAFGCTNTVQRSVTVSPTPTIVVASATPTICLNQSATFTLSGASVYTTQPGLITASLVNVSPTATTIYSIQSLLGACPSSTTTTITVNPLPTLTVASTPTNLCTGNTASLTANGAVSYTWQPINVSGATTTVSPMTTTLYTITGTSSLSCVGSATLSLLVSPTPSMTASNSQTAICIGGSTSLTANGAVNYTWNPGALTGSMAVVSPTTTTTYTLLGNNGSICSQSITITVTVNALPALFGTSTPTAICVGSSATIVAGGANTYTWTGLNTGNSTVVSPTTNSTFTVTGTDNNGCINSITIPLVVNANPTLSAVANPTVVCEGTPATLSVSGAQTYTWLPQTTNGASVSVSPTIASTYTINGLDNNGCAASATVAVATIQNPTITLSASVASICVGQSNTLSALGGTSYTWNPGSTQASSIVITPSSTSIYTAVGSGTNGCTNTATIVGFVNPLPANLTAAASNTISCATPTVSLNASSSSTPVAYVWSGPNSFTSAVQNPGGITQAGGYTVVVTNTITGCVDSVGTNVIYDNSIPTISVTITPSITCADPAPLIYASNTTTNAGYFWTGPNSFTSTSATPTVTSVGNYTVVLTDLTSSCTDTAVVTVGIHTTVATTASFTPATCSLGISSNNGIIQLVNFDLNDRYALVAGTSFTGTLTYTSAIAISSTGIVSSTIANPTGTVAYTLRIFDLEGCTKDTTFIVVPVDCALYGLGIAKAVSSPIVSKDGSYLLSYTVTAKNYDAVAISNVNLTDNLTAAFPAPCEFSVESTPALLLGSGLTLNNSFNGVSNTSLTAPNNSSITVGDSVVFTFQIRVRTPKFNTTYYNSILGTAIGSSNVAVSDSSNNGFDTRPKLNLPTPTNFALSTAFGLSKEASVANVGSGAFEVTYTITAHNFGNDTLRDISITDDLSLAIPSPARYSITGNPIATNGLVVNPTFGATDAQLTSASQSSLLPGTTGSVIFTVRILPDTVSIISNSAKATAGFKTAGNSSSMISVSDISNAGNNPDADGDLICDEENDNLATVVILPLNLDIFVPEGFSPDGDGINEQLIIKGLPLNTTASFTVFNRWGIKVFKSENYLDNDPWDGSANVGGTLGQGKLPQGTYYYVLEVSGSQTRTLTGFIVLQY